jgi:polyhydroxyalkanoate synthesis regulator protein
VRGECTGEVLADVITTDQVEAALEYLRDSAKQAAVARAQAKTLEKYLSVVEAQQKALARGMSNAAAQDAARASPEFKTALDAWEEAVKRDGEFQMLREAAAARIEAWRTMCSNARAEGKAY